MRGQSIMNKVNSAVICHTCDFFVPYGEEPLVQLFDGTSLGANDPMEPDQKHPVPMFLVALGP